MHAFLQAALLLRVIQRRVSSGHFFSEFVCADFLRSCVVASAASLEHCDRQRKKRVSCPKSLENEQDLSQGAAASLPVGTELPPFAASPALLFQASACLQDALAMGLTLRVKDGVAGKAFQAETLMAPLAMEDSTEESLAASPVVAPPPSLSGKAVEELLSLVEACRVADSCVRVRP